jgi:hypothetical protein
MARSRDISKVLSSNTTLATDAEVAATYQTKATTGMVLLNTTSFSTQSTVSIDNVFSATYDTYLIRGSYVGSVDTGVEIRLRVGGADNAAANYERQIFDASNSSTSFARLTGQTSWPNYSGVTTTYNAVNIFEIHRPFNTSPTLAISLMNTAGGANDVRAQNSYFKHTASTSFTGFSLLPNSGTITGSISVLGYNK